MKYLKILLMSCVLSSVGCVSVNSIKSQLESSDDKVVNQGKDKLFKIMGGHWYNGEVQYGIQRISDSDMVSLLQQIEDNDILIEIIDVLVNNIRRDKDVFREACSRVRFSDESKAISFIQKYKYVKRGLDLPSSEWNVALRSAVEAVMSEHGLEMIFNELNPSVMNYKFAHSNGKGGELDMDLIEMVNLRVANLIKNQVILAKIARGDSRVSSQECMNIAAMRITDENILFSLIRYSCVKAEKVISKMTKKFIIQKLIEAKDEDVNYHNTYDTNFGGHIPTMLDRLGHDKLYLYLAENSKSGLLIAKAVERIKDKSILANSKFISQLKDANSTKANQIIERLIKNEPSVDLIHSIITNLPYGVSVELQLALAKRIQDGRVARLYFNKIDFSGVYRCSEINDSYGEIISQKAFEILSLLLSKMERHERKSIEDKAFSAAQSTRNDKIVFEGMYVGMPFVDFVVVANAHKLDIRDFRCSYGSEYPYKSLLRKKDWRNEAVMCRFTITSKDVLKFIDCEDAQILNQIIHKYVMNKKGVCKNYEYLNLIKYQAEDKSSSSKNYYTGETSYNINVKGWLAYSNTKKGTKISFEEKDGLIRFSNP